MNTFDDYAYYYNAFYGDKDYSNEAKIVSDFIKEYKPDAVSILDMGCGTGRHDAELAKRNYKILGIDLSPKMVEIAQNNRTNGTDFKVCDIKSFRTEKRFDCVISLFHVMSYMNSNRDIIDAFQTANVHLSEGDLFIFDLWYGPGVLSDKPAVRTKRVEDDQNILIRNAVPVFHVDKDIVDVNYDVLIIDKETAHVKELHETHKMRYYFKPELELMLEMAGFELLKCVDCNTLQETDFDSWTAYIVARKRAMRQG